MNDSRRTLLFATVVLFAAGVFVADLLNPLGATAWVLYLPVVLAPVLLNSPRQIVIASLACSALVVAGLFLGHADTLPWRGARNRCMGLMALWLTAFTGIVICRRSFQLAHTMKSLLREQERLRSLEHQMLEITAREQRRIGQELHDGVGQELTGLGLMANVLAERLGASATETHIAARLVAGLDRLHQQVRTLSRGLVPVPVEAKGLWAALDDLAASTTQLCGIPVTFDCPQRIEVPDHATATQLFRIAQEAVSNALRHSQARHIRVALLSAPHGLHLTIHDDGIGVRHRPGPGNGMGLRIMQYRAEQIGGALQIGPGDGGGTVVTCVVARGNGDDRDQPGGGTDRGEDLDRG